jgi:hypothetical protein
MNAVSRAALLVLLGLLAADVSITGLDGDLWWQRALGEFILAHHALPQTLGPATFAAPDSRWLPHEWVFATLWALAARADAATVFRFGCVLVAGAALAIDALRARGAAPAANTIALTLVVVGMLPSFGVRAQIVAWPLLALVLLALETGPRAAWWTIGLAIVWDNLHASGLIVPALVLVYSLGRALTQRRWSIVAWGLALAAATGLASAVTPFGFGYARFAAEWSVNPATSIITEWQPISRSALLMFIGPFALFALILVGELRGARLSWSQRFVGLALFGAALLHTRNIPLFCIAAGPWAAHALSALLPRESAAPARSPRSDAGLLVVAAIGACLLAVAGDRVTKPPADDPSAAVARLAASRRALRVACEDFSTCSRFAATPNVRVFIDGRVDGYPASVVADYRRILAGDTARVLERWDVDAVLVQRDSSLARSLRRPHWQRVMGGGTQLYLRV